MARRVSLLGQVAPAVRVVTLEPGRAGADRLFEDGVTAMHCADAAEARRDIADAAAVWLTDASLGRYLPEADCPPLILDIDELPSVAAANSRRPLGRNSDGLGTLVYQHEAQENDLFGRCELIICADQYLATEIRRRTQTGVRVVAPSAWTVDEKRPFILRGGALHYGRWTSEPGHPDEDGFNELLSRLEGSSRLELTALGQDIRPILRANIPSSVAVPPIHEWCHHLRTTRVALLPRQFGAPPTSVLAELASRGVPFLTTTSSLSGLPQELAVAELELGPPGAWEQRLLDVTLTPSGWRACSTAVQALASAWLDPVAQSGQLGEILGLLGFNASQPIHRSTADVPASPKPLATTGTLRDAPLLAPFERQLVGGRMTSRPVYRMAQEMLDADEGYDLWRAGHLDTDASLERQREEAASEHGPTISIVLPTYDADPQILSEAIDSVVEQTWPHWQLCLVDDASPSSRARHVIDRACRSDERVVALYLDENQGIAGATNAGLDLATGDFVGFLDHDDILRPSALWWVTRFIAQDPAVDLLYTDEDRLDPTGRLISPFFKPDWSPDFLLSVNYVTHFTVIRRSLLDAVGRIRTGFDGAQDHDLLLRVTEHTDRIGHIAKPLYAWRQIEGSTSADSQAKPEAHDAGRRAITEALQRRGLPATVQPGFGPNWHWVRHHVLGDPLVSIIVPTRNRHDLLAECIEQTESTTASDSVEFVVVDNQSDDPDTLAWLAAFEADGRGKVVRYPHRFNFARQINLAAAAASGSVLLMLNNDARPLTKNWLHEMLGHALRPEVGAVGARLLWPDGRPQHEGIVLNVGGIAWNVSATDQGVYTRNTRNVTAATGACLMSRRAVFEAVGGMDEQLRVAFNDVDYCLRVGELGFRIIYTPWAELVHAESSTRGTLHPDDDERFYQGRWGPPDSIRDPFYNVSLDMADPVRFRI